MRILLLIGLFVLSACGAAEKQPAASSRSSDQDAQPVAPPPAAAAPVAPPIPADFAMPSFAPLYPGATIQSVNSGSVGGDPNHEVRLATSDDAATVAAFYRARFAAAGMQKSSDFVSGGTAMLSAIGRARRASIAITKGGQDNVVIVTYSGA